MKSERGSRMEAHGAALQHQDGHGQLAAEHELEQQVEVVCILKGSRELDHEGVVAYREQPALVVDVVDLLLRDDQALVHLLERPENDLEDRGGTVEDGGLGGCPAHLVCDVDHLPLPDQDLDSLGLRPRHERHQQRRRHVVGGGLVARHGGEQSRDVRVLEPRVVRDEVDAQPADDDRERVARARRGRAAPRRRTFRGPRSERRTKRLR